MAVIYRPTSPAYSPHCMSAHGHSRLFFLFSSWPYSLRLAPVRSISSIPRKVAGLTNNGCLSEALRVVETETSVIPATNCPV